MTTPPNRSPHRLRVAVRRNALALAAAGAVAAGGVFGVGAAQAETSWAAPVIDFHGYLEQRSEVLYPGTTGHVGGKGFIPGQKVHVLVDGKVITTEDEYTVDKKGKLDLEVKIPEDASVGRHPVVVETTNPVTTSVMAVKVSKKMDLMNEDQFDHKKVALDPAGLYEIAYSAKNGTIFVTATLGKIPPKSSVIHKLDANTLEILGQGNAGPDAESDGMSGVYGVGVDDANDTVWATNSRTSSVAVFKQSDLSLVKQFPRGVSSHAHDIRVDPVKGLAYSTSTYDDVLDVFDAKTLEPVKRIKIPSKRVKFGQLFQPMRLEIDVEGRKLYTVSLRSSEAAVFDLDKVALDRVISVPDSTLASGVSVAPELNLLFVASQDSDSLHIIDMKDDDKILHDVYVGAGALNVVYEPVNKLVYVITRTEGKIVVIEPKAGEIVAVLDGGKNANHLATDGKGAVFAVNQARKTGEDFIHRIVKK